MKNRRGFTFIELMMSLIIMGLIAAAISGFAIAVSSQWRSTNQQQLMENTGQRSQATLGSVIENSRAFNVVSDPTRTQMILWYSDSINGASDGVAQLAELAVVEYDTTLKSIMLYRADLTQTYETSSSAQMVVLASDLYNGNVADFFKAQTWVKPARPILGPGAATTDTSLTQVAGAAFTAFSGSSHNGVAASVEITRDGQTSDFTKVFSPRSPMTPGAVPNTATAITTVVAASVTSPVSATSPAASVSASVNALGLNVKASASVK